MAKAHCTLLSFNEGVEKGAACGTEAVSGGVAGMRVQDCSELCCMGSQ